MKKKEPIEESIFEYYNRFVSEQLPKMGSLGLLGYYFLGDAEPLTLEQIGVEDRVKNLVKSPNQLGKSNGHSLQRDFIQQILAGKTHFRNGYRLKSKTDISNDALWAIGGVIIEGQFYGEAVSQNGNYFLVGTIHYSLTDKFTDPFDTFDWREGEIDVRPPFDITGNWVEPINISITKEQYERLKK